ncbi:MAG TPA: hypothetical protein VNN17_06995 [Terriglobia bacterium]|nr:hypothetical protein [Terriglobia bacterium]
MTLSGMLLLLVLAAIVFAAIKLLPPYIDNYRLQDTLDTIARNATYSNRLSEADIRNEVLAEARELGIPLEPRQVNVQRSGASVNIAVRYVITVDLLVRQVDLNFEPAAGNRNIMARP